MMTVIKEEIDITQVMEKWARWRVYRAGDELGYGECLTGKLIDGLPKVVCTAPGCNKGATKIKLNGQIFNMPCSQCLGSGWMTPKSRGNKINPKLIRTTGGKYPDEQSSRVDRLVCQLNYIQQAVIFQEYTANGTREIKQDRIGIGRTKYDATLSTAHGFIMAGL